MLLTGFVFLLKLHEFANMFSRPSVVLSGYVWKKSVYCPVCNKWDSSKIFVKEPTQVHKIIKKNAAYLSEIKSTTKTIFCCRAKPKIPNTMEVQCKVKKHMYICSQMTLSSEAKVEFFKWQSYLLSLLTERYCIQMLFPARALGLWDV